MSARRAGLVTPDVAVVESGSAAACPPTTARLAAATASSPVSNLFIVALSL
jgi:hypothetical protein